MLIKKLEIIISKFIQKQRINAILIAVSGGQDSILLIKLLDSINNKFKNTLKLSYIYIDHQWKKNSYIQIEHLINYIKLNNNNLVIYQINQITESETECRKQRYHIIKQHAIYYKYNLIITGHNSTDKIETFFQNINRKSGIEGFSSLVIDNDIYNKVSLFRPLLIINKEQIYWLCKKNKLPIWSDSTNYIYNINRNRIRHELIPYMRNFFNPKIENNLIHSIHNYYYENEYIKQNAIKMYLANKHKQKIAINYQNISKQHFILQIKIIQIFYLHNLQIKLDDKIIKKIFNKTTSQFKRLNIIFEDTNYKYILNNKWLYVEVKCK